MSKSRIKNTILNAMSGIISYILILVVTFFMRRVFVDKLGDDFLGINTLYTNIINMLSISELGITTAILFFLYQPVAEGNESRIRSFMRWYARAYRVIAGVVLAIGLFLTVFIDVLSNTDVATPWSLRFYFLFFVANAAVSYLMAYKRSILYADQNTRFVNWVHTFAKLVCTGLQIAVLLITKNYYLFLTLFIFFSVLENVIITVYVNRKYKFLRSSEPVEELRAEEKKEIWVRIKPLIVQNVALLVLDYTDTIIINLCINPATLGFYGNYTLIASTLRTLFGQVFAAFTVSFGNLAVSETKEKCRKVFEHSQFFAFWIASSWTACYVALAQPFIGDIWMGESKLLGVALPFSLGASFYVTCLYQPSRSAQNSLGLHSKDAWAMIVCTAVNILVSLALVKSMGAAGVALGTALASLIPLVAKDKVIYKHFFQKSAARCILKQVMWIALAAGLVALDYFAVLYIPGHNFAWFLLKMAVAFLLPNLLLILLLCKTSGFRYYKDMLKRLIHRGKTPPSDSGPTGGTTASDADAAIANHSADAEAERQTNGSVCVNIDKKTGEDALCRESL